MSLGAVVLAATKEQVAKFGTPWTMSMTGEFGFIIALIIGNFFPGLANLMKEAARPELYIKTGIVIMGAGLGTRRPNLSAWPPTSCSGASAPVSRPREITYSSVCMHVL